MDAAVLQKLRSLPLAARIGAAVVVVVLVFVVGLAACSGDGKKNAAPPAPRIEPTAFVKFAPLKLGSVNVASAGAKVDLDASTRNAALAQTRAYVDAAVHTPIETGKIGAGYANVFEPALRAAATGKDRGALTDESVGKASNYSEAAQPVAVSAIADGFGNVLYVATNFTLTGKAKVDGQPLNIVRRVELTLAPQDAKNKEWRVAAYRILTVRKAPKSGTTTTTAATSGVSAP